MAKDVLPDAHESREFKASTEKLVAEAKRVATPQRAKFEELARELECDEDEAKFEEQVKRVAKNPKAEPPPEKA